MWVTVEHVAKSLGTLDQATSGITQIRRRNTEQRMMPIVQGGPKQKCKVAWFNLAPKAANKPSVCVVRVTCECPIKAGTRVELCAHLYSSTAAEQPLNQHHVTVTSVLLQIVGRQFVRMRNSLRFVAEVCYSDKTTGGLPKRIAVFTSALA